MHIISRGPWTSFWMTILAFFYAGVAVADFTPDAIDGDISEWPTDPSQFFIFQDSVDMGGFLAHRDIVQVWVSDDNSEGSTGNLYLAIEFAGDFQPTVWGFDIDITLYLDTDGDGVHDVELEITEGLTQGTDWDYEGSYMEVAIPYSTLGLSFGDDDIGISFGTGGFINSSDITPADENGDPTFIDYDGTADGGTGDPRAVRMLEQYAYYNGNGVQISWKTGAERQNAGFHIYRYDSARAKKTARGWIRLTNVPVPGMGDTAFGRTYGWTDPLGEAGDQYLIEDVEYSGGRKTHGALIASSQKQKAVRFLPQFRLLDVSDQKEGRSALSRIQSLFAEALSLSPLKTDTTQSVLKYQVESPGMYLIPYKELRGLGFYAPGQKKSRIVVQRDGQTIPVKYKRKGVWFYGEPRIDRYGEDEVYTVIKAPKKRMKSIRTNGDCSRPIRSVVQSHRAEQDATYYIAAPWEDPFFWASAYLGFPASVGFDAPGYTVGDAQLLVTMVGYAYVPGPDHIIEVILNGQSLGPVEWDGWNLTNISLDISAGQLLEEGNTLELVLLNEDVPDVVMIDSVELRYMKNIAMTDGGIRFDAPGDECIQVKGIVDDEWYMVFDVTDPDEPIRITGSKRNRLKGYLRFMTPPSLESDPSEELPPGVEASAPQRSYFVLPRSAMTVPEEIGSFPVVSPLRSSSNRGEYLVITHPSLKAGADILANYHRDAGKQVKVVDVNEIYDAFGGGRKSPHAIQAFLDAAADGWELPPQFVVLMGAATVDPSGKLGTGVTDYIPAPFYGTHLNNYEAASDGWYVKNLPGVAIGRFAVESEAEAIGVTTKVVNWYNGIGKSGTSLYIADQDEEGLPSGEGPFEESAMVQMDAAAGVGEFAEILFRNETTTPIADMTDAMNAGVDFVNFHGHAYLSGWSSGPQLATISSAEALENTHLFVLMSWSCFDGTFVGPYDDSLAWAFVKNPVGGAVVAVASSSLSSPASVTDLSAETTYQLASGVADTIGQALYNAKAVLYATKNVNDEDAASTFNILGDPAAPNPWSL